MATQSGPNTNEVTAEPMTPEQQVEYWMERCFKAEDERTALINHLNAISRAVNQPDDRLDDRDQLGTCDFDPYDEPHTRTACLHPDNWEAL